MPKVTVLMAVFNAEKYIREAMDSVLNQTFENFEFLIVYDKSSDRTLEILRSYADTRIKVIENSEQLGFVKSLNTGLSLADGEFIARMDADDISRQDRLALELEYFDGCSWKNIVCSSIDVMDSMGVIIDHVADALSPEEIYYTLNFRNCIAHGTAMFRKSIIEEMGNYNVKSIVEDYELWYRISKKFIINKIDNPLYVWRTHNTSLSFVHYNKQQEAVYAIFKANLINLLGRNVKDKLARLMWDNFCNTNYVDRNSYSYTELVTIAKLIRELNTTIIDVAPIGLSKSFINDLGNEKYVRYLVVTAKKLGLFKTLELINEIDENSVYKASIIRKLVNNLIKNKKNISKYGFA